MWIKSTDNQLINSDLVKTIMVSEKTPNCFRLLACYDDFEIPLAVFSNRKEAEAALEKTFEVLKGNDIVYSEYLSKTIPEVFPDISVRAYNILYRHRIYTLNDLYQKRDKVKFFHGCGEKTINEINTYISKISAYNTEGFFSNIEELSHEN